MRTHIPAWGGRRAQAALAQVKREGRRRNTPCHLCGKPIDYNLDWPHPWACTVEHPLSRHTHPHLTWDPANWQPAHHRCNSIEGASNTTPTLGPTSNW